jgi:hypothetical protein
MTPMSSVPGAAQASDQGYQQPQAAPANFNMASFMGTAPEATGPTAEETAQGISEQLKQVMVIANAVAGANPQLAEPMKQIRQIAVESILQTQQQAGGGNSE